LSHFRRAISTLASLSPLRVFSVMEQTGEALPLSIAVQDMAVTQAPCGTKAKVRSALAKLRRSRRYAEAALKEGAQVYGADGLPRGPVPDGFREWARGVLAEKLAAHEKRVAQASYQTDPKWAAKILRGEVG